MNNLISFTVEHWLFLALGSSLYWGARSLFLFTRDPQPQLLSERPNRIYFLRRQCPCLGTFFIASYQFTYNFVGSMVGWCCLYVLLIRVQPLQTTTVLGSGNLALLFLAFLGVTGHLPQATYGLVGSFGRVGEAIINKVSKS